jgi:hypothetical protein
MGRPRTQNGTYRIMDRDALAHELKRAVDRLGSLRKAAKVTDGRSDKRKSTWLRLINGELSSITQDTLNAIFELVPAQRHQRVMAALLPPAALELARAAREAQEAEIDRIQRLPRGQRWKVIDGQMVVGRSDDLIPYRAGSHVQMHPREVEAQFLMLRARALPGCAHELDALCRAMDHDRQRIELAWLRIIAPLLCYRESAFVERSWQELTDAEFRQFVVAGIRREKILLTRPNDLRRAQDVVAETEASERLEERAEVDYVQLNLSGTYELAAWPIDLSGDGRRSARPWDGSVERSDIAPDLQRKPRASRQRRRASRKR